MWVFLFACVRPRILRLVEGVGWYKTNTLVRADGVAEDALEGALPEDEVRNN